MPRQTFHTSKSLLPLHKIPPDKVWQDPEGKGSHFLEILNCYLVGISKVCLTLQTRICASLGLTRDVEPKTTHSVPRLLV